MISYRESQLKRVLESLNKPTVITPYGTKKWENKEGELHRLNDKPAIEYKDGGKEWWINGLRHRENDKPAIENVDGKKVWYINGKFIKQNYNSYGMVHNDKFFNEYGNEIKTTIAQLKDIINKNNTRVIKKYIEVISSDNGNSISSNLDDKIILNRSNFFDNETFVSETIKYLKREGVSEYSSWPFEADGWYSIVETDLDGNTVIYSYFLSNYTIEEQKEIYNKVMRKTMAKIENKKNDINRNKTNPFTPEFGIIQMDDDQEQMQNSFETGLGWMPISARDLSVIKKSLWDNTSIPGYTDPSQGVQSPFSGTGELPQNSEKNWEELDKIHNRGFKKNKRINNSDEIEDITPDLTQE